MFDEIKELKSKYYQDEMIHLHTISIMSSKLQSIFTAGTLSRTTITSGHYSSDDAISCISQKMAFLSDLALHTILYMCLFN